MNLSSSSPFLLSAQAGTLAFYACVFIFALYSIVVAYHLLRYGRRSPLTIPALALYGFVGALLILLAASGLPSYG